MKLNKSDLKILNCLIEHPELSSNQVAEKLEVSPQTVYNSLNRLRSNKVLVGFAPLLDLDALGYVIRAKILFNVEFQVKDKIVKELKSNPCVLQLQELSGPFSLGIEACFKSTKDLYALTKKLSENDSVNEIETHVIYNEFKKKYSPFPLIKD